MGKIKDKVAIVTGGSRGMGKATVERFADEGAKVIITDILDEEGQALVDELSTDVGFFHLDISDETAWEELVKTAIAQYGRIDILVNNAAIFAYTMIEETKSDDFRRLLDINLLGPYLGIKAVLPVMKEKRSGSIINVCSVDGLRGNSGASAYCASKWGLRGLTKCVALEAGPFGIRVNSIHPGAIDTPMLNPSQEGTDKTDKWFPGIPLSRVGQPAEVAAASLFLASDDASYINGAEISVDGGWNCGVYLSDKPGIN